MYYSYVEIKYVATSFSPARMDLAVKLLIGRWSSMAFLKYIRKQVQEFLHGILSKMIKIQSFKHVQNSLMSHYPTSMHPMREIVGDSFAVMVA
jgi:hypothetical protein